jgi:hypothetical protein
VDGNEHARRELYSSAGKGFIGSPSFELALLEGSRRNPGLELAGFPFAKVAYAAMKILLLKAA